MSDAQFRTEQLNAYLNGFLQEHAAALKNILCVYVLRADLASGANAHLVTEEIFQDTVVQVMALGERFMSVQQPRTWFLRVALNILLRRRASLAKRARFEVLVSDLAARSAVPGEDDFLEQLATPTVEGPEQAFESREQVREMLSLVSPEDARVLNLIVLYEFDAGTVGRQLGMSPEAVRVRLHRALRRLRKAWSEHELNRQRGDN